MITCHTMNSDVTSSEMCGGKTVRKPM